MDQHASPDEDKQRGHQDLLPPHLASTTTTAQPHREDGVVSPFSTFSLEGGSEEDDSSSMEMGSASSQTVNTGRRSLQRRAREFDRILSSQRNVLTDFDVSTAHEPEDDDLQSELQDLARSESLLRKELELFATQFRRQSSGVEEESHHVTSSKLEAKSACLLCHPNNC